MADGNAITVSSGKKSTVKDPQAVLDYPFNWADWLAGIEDTYASHEFVIANPEGAAQPLAVVSSSEDAGVITAFVSGGTLGLTHGLTCRITTNGGRVDDRTLFFKIKDT